MEPTLIATQAAINAAKFAGSTPGRKLRGIPVLLVDLDSDLEMVRLTNVIEVHTSRFAEWSAEIHQRTRTGRWVVNGSAGHSGSSRPIGDHIGYIELWQFIPWWRRCLWWRGTTIVQYGRACNVLMPGSGDGMKIGYSTAVSVVASKPSWRGRLCWRGFYVQSIIDIVGENETIDRLRKKTETLHLHDPKGLRLRPRWRWVGPQ